MLGTGQKNAYIIVFFNLVNTISEFHPLKLGNLREIMGPTQKKNAI